MIQGIHNSAAAADGLEKWVDVISQNIASSSTPGFKGNAMLFDGVMNGTMGLSSGGTRAVQHDMMSPLPTVGINFDNGENQRTGDPNECAIEGDGFFRLQRPDGDYVYTRDGQFHVSAQGQLESKQGYPVMGESGPIQLLIDQGPFTVEPDGRVRQGDQEVGTISVYNFEDLSQLNRTTGGFIPETGNEATATVSTIASVRQGYREMSNISPMREMANLISITSAMQANQKVIQSVDQVLERAVQQLGSTS